MLLCFAIAFAVTAVIIPILQIEPFQGFIPWAAYCLISTTLFTIIYIANLYISTEGARNMMRRLIKRG